MKTAVLLAIDLMIGFLYYCFATSKSRCLRQTALIFKISLLAISFLLEFVGEDFILVNRFTLGKHTTVLWLILFEVADALVSARKDRETEEKHQKQKP